MQCCKLFSNSSIIMDTQSVDLSSIRCFEYDDKHFSVTVNFESQSEFDVLLQSLWSEKMEKGYFRYKLDNLETKILLGKYGFIAQLNIKRAIERRKPQFVSSLRMPFNADLFHFMKIVKEEILFRLYPLHRYSNVDKDMPYNLLAINVSPLEYCNSLLIPNITKCYPQVFNSEGLQLALEVMLLSHDPSLRIGFNSLGAYASVNHLHFHMYFLKYKLYLESSVVNHLADNCYEITDFPAKGFAFQLLDTDILPTVRSVNKLVTYLMEQNIPCNVFITRGNKFQDVEGKCSQIASESSYDAVRIFVWARAAYFGAKEDEAFNPALCELAGHLPIKSKEHFDSITEDKVIETLNDVCLETFMKVRDAVKLLFCSS